MVKDKPLNENLIVIIICIFAAIRLAFFNAAFPFFNNVDENQHVDMVVKYARGEGWLPKTDRFDKLTARWIVLYGSPEYLNSREKLEKVQPLTPLWRLKQKSGAKQVIEKKTAVWEKSVNHDVYAPPLYYTLMGIWYHTGKLIGLNQDSLLYWLKASNIIFYTLLILVSAKLLGHIFPANPDLRKSILLMLAVFPQDVFYSINSDIPSALLVPLIFLIIIQPHNNLGSCRRTVFLAITLSALVLTKLSNLPAFGILLLTALWRLFRHTYRVKNGVFSKQLLLLISISFLPLIVWGIRNHMLAQDILATSHKVNFLGWHTKTLHQMLDHPIITFGGFYVFIGDMLKTFWRGEFVWHLKRIASKPMDYFFMVSSIIFCSITMIGHLGRQQTENMDKYRIIFFGCALLISSYLFFLCALSMRYDFGNSAYPSSVYPYFTSGRLMIGSLFPFLVLYMTGLWSFLERIGLSERLFQITVGLASIVVVNEIFITLPALRSPFNLFHILLF